MTLKADKQTEAPSRLAHELPLNTLEKLAEDDFDSELAQRVKRGARQAERHLHASFRRRAIRSVEASGKTSLCLAAPIDANHLRCGFVGRLLGFHLS